MALALRILAGLQMRAITKQEFAPCEFRAFGAQQKRGRHTADTLAVNVMHRDPPRDRDAKQQQARAIGGALGRALRHRVENLIGELGFPVIEALLAIPAQ